MKYGYKNIENGELIQNYTIDDGKIKITFLDGTYYEMPLTIENEINLLNKMFKQAEDRSQSSALEDAKKRKKRILLSNAVGFFSVALLISTVSAIVLDVPYTTSALLGINAGFGMALADKGSYKHQKEEIEELEKYDIYLAMREVLEKNIANPILYNEIDKQHEGLNINTLDEYSLKDIKVIQNNLKRIEEYSQYFTDASNVPVLEKKINRKNHC